MRELITKESKTQFNRIWDKLSIGGSALNYDSTSKTYRQALEACWRNYYGKDVTDKVRQGLYNMILTHYAETKLDDLPVGSVGYVLGRKKAFNKHIKKVLQERGMVWEREDASKATFFIIGDIMTKEDNLLNQDLKLPIVMDITIENEYHHKHSGTDYITSINEHVLTSLFRRGERKDLDTMSVMLKFIHADALSNKVRTRLVMQYLKCVGTGYDYADIKHKNLIRLMRRVTLPQHQFLLEPKFANSYNTVGYSTAGSSTLKSSGADNLGYLGLKTWGSDINNFIPMEEDTLDLFFEDLEEKLYFDENLSDFKSYTWETSSSTHTVFDGSLVKTMVQLAFGELEHRVDISYFSPKTKDDGCYLIDASGRRPSKGYYRGVESQSFSTTDHSSAKFLNLMRPHIKQPQYKAENVSSNGWSENLYSPVKKYIEELMTESCEKFYGKRVLKLFPTSNISQ